MLLDVELSVLVPFSCCIFAVLVVASIGSQGKDELWSPVSRIAVSLRCYLRGWNYIFHGHALIKDLYTKSCEKPFEVFAPDNRYVLVSSPQHIKEIDSAPPDHLSLFTATKQMLQPRYTMHGFNWPNVRGADGIGFVRAIRTMLTNHLPVLVPKLTIILGNELSQIASKSETHENGKAVPLFDAIKQLTALSDAYAFFGEDLARVEEFMKAAARTAQDIFIYAELIRNLPKFLQPVMGKLVLWLSTAQSVVYHALIPVVEQRLNERSQGRLGQKEEMKQDVISWIINTGPKSWPAYRIVYELLAIWFGAMHGISIMLTFAIEDLCLRPEYLEPLRKEIESDAWSEFASTGQGLPLLDSFIKESTRLSPVECVSGRRQALKPFQFSDGTNVQKGEWVCTPAGAIMQNSSWYPEADQFHGFRFADRSQVNNLANKGLYQAKPSRLTDTDDRWHVWGIGRITCPGRFYAATTMKIVLAEIIRNYDPELLDHTAPRMSTWRSSMIPSTTTKIVLRPRA